MSKPLSPDEVASSSTEGILPSIVVDSVNTLLKQRFRNGRAEFNQEEIIKEIMAAHNHLNPEPLLRADIFEKKMLNFEAVFERAGWKVIYDKPDYSENWIPTFTFTRK